MQVLSVASEIFPLIKTGGLADVAGALPGALAAQGVVMRTLVPGYPAVLAGLEPVGEAVDLGETMGGPVRLLAGRAAGLDLLVARRAPSLRPPGQSLSRPGRPRLAGQLPPLRAPGPRRRRHRAGPAGRLAAGPRPRP